MVTGALGSWFFFPRGVWFAALCAPITPPLLDQTHTHTHPHTHTHTHTHTTIYSLPPFAHLCSQVWKAHWGPWGRETKIVIGSSLSLAALCASPHLNCSLVAGRQQRPREAPRRRWSHPWKIPLKKKKKKKAEGRFGWAAPSGVERERERRWWPVVHYCVLNIKIRPQHRRRSLHCGD